ncbi:MAG: acyl-CoA dehydrogenase, partial [Rhodobacteraceae bacterium]|nr:acyl-CoA dehydrogenase [Paracoccaceae bacterium]
MYVAPLKDIGFTLDQVLNAGRLAGYPRYAEATPETIKAVLSEAGRLAQEVMAPLNHASDLQGARLENGVVRTTPGFKHAYEQMAEGGWVGMAASQDHGGMGLPITLLSAVNEMMASSCLSLSLCPLLSQGAIEALETHGSPEQQALYLPKLISGEWSGAMNLTEPQAGSDVGALRAKATPNGDGSYAIEGGKIWISWGDTDFASNVVHLVLARLPDAPPGPKGVSLFIVPKFILNENGDPGERNQLKVVSLDHKLGLHGSPTCVMAYEGATGWLVGGEHQGMACMFTMMNNARLGVGLEGVGVAEAAYQKALAFALERKQGRTPGADGRGGEGTGAIVEHADVRRMLLTMKAQTQAARAMAYDCAFHLDLARAASSQEERKAAAAMGAFLTPIAKAFGTDTGNEVAHFGVQVHGGMGFIEETGAAQFSRDVRVTAIYEGTNGIQALDLVGRKLSMDSGDSAKAYLDRCDATAERLSAEDGQFAQIGANLAQMTGEARSATLWMLEAGAVDRAAGAAAYLRALALVGGAAHLGVGALNSGEPGRLALANFFAVELLPGVLTHAQ